MNQLQLVLTVVDHAQGGQKYDVKVATEFPRGNAEETYSSETLASIFKTLATHMTVDPLETIAFTLILNGEVVSEQVA